MNAAKNLPREAMRPLAWVSRPAAQDNELSAAVNLTHAIRMAQLSYVRHTTMTQKARRRRRTVDHHFLGFQKAILFNCCYGRTAIARDPIRSSRSVRRVSEDEAFVVPAICGQGRMPSCYVQADHSRNVDRL